MQPVTVYRSVASPSARRTYSRTGRRRRRPRAPGTISGDEALRRIMDGNARYRANQTHVRDFSVGRAARVTTHRPIASILSCSDARVGPEFLFDQGPGDLFVVRVAGNILQEEGLASLEYAAEFLGAPLIFVLGHSNCGALDAAIKVVKDNATLPGHLPGLIDQLKPAVLAAQETHPRTCSLRPSPRKYG